MITTQLIISFLLTGLFGLSQGRNVITPLKIKQCRDTCLEKFAEDIPNINCFKDPNCAAKFHLGGVPIKKDQLYIHHCQFICENQCWDKCESIRRYAKLLPEKWPVSVLLMTRQSSVVSVQMSWKPAIQTDQCLITWEVTGGGFLGNLMTDAYKVELSLWPDTLYDLSVTCENKDGAMTQSMPLTINTADAVSLFDEILSDNSSKIETNSKLNTNKDGISTSSNENMHKIRIVPSVFMFAHKEYAFFIISLLAFGLMVLHLLSKRYNIGLSKKEKNLQIDSIEKKPLKSKTEIIHI